MILVLISTWVCPAFTPTANAAFETWVFPTAPLPYALKDVTFHREDKRKEVSTAIRKLVKDNLNRSGLFRPSAKSQITVELLQVSSNAVVDRDGAALGRTEILYRVKDENNKVLLNDRIRTEAVVSVKDSIPLRQSTKRAARYRSFSKNLEAFTVSLWRSQITTGTPKKHALNITLGHDLETPERTKDFVARAQKALAITAPGLRASDASLNISSLNIHQNPSPDTDTFSANIQMSLALVTEKKQVLWSGKTSANGKASTLASLSNGLNPMDTAIANALQTALRSMSDKISSASLQYAEETAVAIHYTLPYHIIDVSLGKGAKQRAYLTTLKHWTQGQSPLSGIWDSKGKGLKIQLENIKTKIKADNKTSGTANFTVTFVVTDEHGETLMMTRRSAETPFHSQNQRRATRHDKDQALHAGFLQTWGGLLKQIASLSTS